MFSNLPDPLKTPDSPADLYKVMEKEAANQETVDEKVSEVKKAPNSPPTQIQVIESQIFAVTEQLMKARESLEKHEEKVNKTRKKGEDLADRIAELQETYHKLLQELSTIKYATFDKQQAVKTLEKQLQDLQAKRLQILAQENAVEQLKKLEKELDGKFGDRKWWQLASDFQREDIIFKVAAFLSGENGILNANVMGSGKTLEAAAFMEVMLWAFQKKYSNLNRLPRMLWVTKKSLLSSTHSELKKWNEKSHFMYIPEGKSPAEREMMISFGLEANAVIVVNYDMLATTPILLNIEWDFVFIDEVHQLKGGANPNGPTRRFLMARKVLGIEEVSPRRFQRTRITTTDDGEKLKQLPFLTMLSATPVQNRPEEVWCWLHLFDPELFPDLKQFNRNFVDYFGAFKPLELLKTLQGRFIRQDPERIYASRPDKDRMYVEIEMTPAQRKIYDIARDYVLAGFDKEPDKRLSITAVIAQLTRLRQINLLPSAVKDDNLGRISLTESGKLDAALEIIEELHSDGEQIVVWSAQFNEPLFELERRVKEALPGIKTASITGATKDPQKIEEDFQWGDIQILFCNMKAAGEGYNFNKNPEGNGQYGEKGAGGASWPGGASHAIFLDRWYNPQVNYQAEDRIWRTGAVQGVKIWILHDSNSVDNLIKQICDEKDDMFNELIEKKELAPSAYQWKETLENLI